MKKTLLIVAAMVAMVVKTNKTEAQIEVVADNYTSLSIHFDAPSVEIANYVMGGIKYQTIEMAGFTAAGHIGGVALPTLGEIIVIPLCEEIEVEVSNMIIDTIKLQKGLPYFPLQPGRNKRDTAAMTRIYVDSGIYREAVLHGMPLATAIPIGIARDRRLAKLTIAPVKVDPVGMIATICRSADIEIRYINPDIDATEEMYNRYHSPAFSTGETLNKLYTSKGGKVSEIQKMIIVAPSSLRCKRLESFANWKRQQGMRVEILYQDIEGLNSAADIATRLKSMFLATTDDDPVATYLMIVGDVEQTPTFQSKLSNNYYYGLDNGHVTDLYYTTWTEGDNLPDCYIGRMSATDTITLGRIVNKTILYESYSFEEDSYLGKAVLVSGVDEDGMYVNENDCAYQYSDPTMDYLAKYYIRRDNGFDTVYYYKNRTNFAPQGVEVTGSSRDTVEMRLCRLYNEGIGWVNYSAHGEWNRWEKPLFNVDNANMMNNVGKPSFMIGNCCLTNKFEKDECLGEALLRRGDNAGAVGYIGATNSTYWGEDFYWSVGVRNRISGTMNATYDSGNLGAYDRIFHTHNEATENCINTAGAMVMAGNISVNRTTGYEWGNIVVPYYWEIYELMGDPSLMPWMGKAKTQTVLIDTTTRPVRVTTVPGAYVAVVDTLTLEVYGAAYANTDGMARIEIPEDIPIEKTFFTSTAQGYKPYIEGVDVVKLGLSVALTVYPNPSVNKRFTIDGTGLKNVVVYNSVGHVLISETADSDNYEINLSGQQPGLYILEVETIDGTMSKVLIVK